MASQFEPAVAYLRTSSAANVGAEGADGGGVEIVAGGVNTTFLSSIRLF